MRCWLSLLLARIDSQVRYMFLASPSRDPPRLAGQAGQRLPNLGDSLRKGKLLPKGPSARVIGLYQSFLGLVLLVPVRESLPTRETCFIIRAAVHGPRLAHTAPCFYRREARPSHSATSSWASRPAPRPSGLRGVITYLNKG